MISPLAIGLAALLAALGGLHLAWGLGLRWPGVDEVSLAERVGGVAPGSRMHAPWMCTVVALALAAGAAVIVGFSAKPTEPAWRILFTLAYLALTAVFFLRGVAGFVAPLWRRTEGTPFHRLNRLYYSPLCLLIAAGLAANFVLG
ncbi:DUF3995 domain-containing protein [Phenylobacterium sp.]|uniref:DUF3995 domain-containing protein n=1 Tax=Phenylobacterium sp. TaxID=1871053 RepID=UPI00286C2A4A|nr:DUF3995 domain-containing protein [Phenylobacterium sp.]